MNIPMRDGEACVEGGSVNRDGFFGVKTCRERATQKFTCRAGEKNIHTQTQPVN